MVFSLSQPQWTKSSSKFSLHVRLFFHLMGFLHPSYRPTFPGAADPSRCALFTFHQSQLQRLLLVLPRHSSLLNSGKSPDFPFRYWCSTRYREIETFQAHGSPEKQGISVDAPVVPWPLPHICEVIYFERTSESKAQGTFFLQVLPDAKSGCSSSCSIHALPWLTLGWSFSKCGLQTLGVPIFSTTLRSYSLLTDGIEAMIVNCGEIQGSGIWLY